MNNIKTWFEKLFIDEAKPALDRHSGGGGGLGDVNATDVATPEEMDLILANATVSNTGDVYHYTGETTENYTQDTYYVLIGEIKLQEKEATGNGEIVPDEGYDGLSKVSVNAPSIVKQLMQIKGGAKKLFYCWDNISDFSGLIEYDDFSNVTDIEYMFGYCNKLTTSPLFDTSNVTNMERMFYHCPNLTTVPLFDTSNVNNMSNMFYNCDALQTVPLFDTSNVTNMSYMFQTCEALQTVPLFDTSNVTNMSYMFNGCKNLTTVPPFDTSNVTNMERIFMGCTSLTTVPLFDTKRITSGYSLFENCTNLSIVPALDLRNVTMTSYIFTGCKNLTELWIKNIKYGIYLENGNTTLSMDSILNLLNETVVIGLWGRTAKLTLGSNNLAKLTGDYEYVKPTGKYLDLDNNEVDKITTEQTKIPVTWCSASDEGAMTVVDYMTSKKWSLA